MGSRRTLVERAYQPWYQRGWQWWMVCYVVVVGLVVYLQHWPLGVIVVIAILGGVLVETVDVMIMRHVRRRNPEPTDPPEVASFRQIEDCTSGSSSQIPQVEAATPRPPYDDW